MLSVDERIARQEDASRATLADLHQKYLAIAATIHELQPSEKAPPFPDFAQMGPMQLKEAKHSADELIARLAARVLQLREVGEEKRKAKLSPIEALKEVVADQGRQIASLRDEVRSMSTRRGSSDPSETVASFLRKPPEAPPILIATVQRGGGAVSKFFGDDEAEPPSGGVRRVGGPQ
jgi:uncharacterized coiled-coil protein SlyX